MAVLPKIKPHLLLIITKDNGTSALMLMDTYESKDKAMAAMRRWLEANPGEIVCYVKVEQAFSASVTLNELSIGYGGNLSEYPKQPPINNTDQ